MRLDLVLAVADIGEVAEIEMLDRVAGGADLLVDLKAALLRRPVVGAEDAVKRPLLVRQRGVSSARAAAERRPATSAAAPARRRTCFSISRFRHRRAGAAEPRARRLRSTAVAMLAGSGRGRSSLPISGNRIRKWTK